MATKLILLPPDSDPLGFDERRPEGDGVKGMLGDLFGERLRRSRERLESLWKNVVVASPMDGPTPKDRVPPSYLSGVSMIIADSAEFDAAAVEANGGSVLDNDPVECAPPEEAAPALLSMQWHQASACAHAPWARGITGQGTWIGVLDTGIDASHPEFAGKRIAAPGTGCFAEFDKHGRLVNSVPRDAGTHGTHVCGIAAGAIRGIAPKAELAVAAVLTYRVNGRMVGYPAQIAAGLNWLATAPFPGADPPGVDVINASLGLLGYHRSQYAAVGNARRISSIQTVACIGNDGTRGTPNHWSPGNYDIVLGIGAVDDQDQVCAFSSWGVVARHAGISKPEMSAPGMSVNSSLPNGQYGNLSGTSMASPCVAAACALAIQADPANLRRKPLALCAKMVTLVRPATAHPAGNLGGAGTLDLTTL